MNPEKSMDGWLNRRMTDIGLDKTLPSNPEVQKSKLRII